MVVRHQVETASPGRQKRWGPSQESQHLPGTKCSWGARTEENTCHGQKQQFSPTGLMCWYQKHNVASGSRFTVCVVRPPLLHHTTQAVWTHLAKKKSEAHDACWNVPPHERLRTPHGDVATHSAGLRSVALTVNGGLSYLVSNLRALFKKKRLVMHIVLQIHVPRDNTWTCVSLTVCLWGDSYVV